MEISINRIEELIGQNLNREALDLLNEELKLDEKSPKLQILKAETFIKLGKINEALELAESMDKSNDFVDYQLNVTIMLIEIYNIIGSLPMSIERYHEAMELLEDNELFDNKKLSHLHKSKIFKEHARTNFLIGELDLSLQFYQDSVDQAHLIDNYSIIATSTTGVAGCYYRKGELNRARSELLISNEFFKKSRDYYHIAVNQNNIGLIFLREGNTAEALKNINLSLEYNIKAKQIEQVAANYNNLGEVYSEMGELETALDFYQKALEIRESNNLLTHFAYVQSSLGTIYYEMNELDKAIKYLELAHSSYQSSGSEKLAAKTIFTLIRIYLEKSNPSEIEKLVEQLTELANTLEDKVTDQMLLIAQAMVLKRKGRLRDLVKSQNLFKQVVMDKIADRSLNLLAMINYCELLNIETTIVDEKAIWEEIETLFESIHQQAKDHHLYPLAVTSSILQSRLAMIKHDYSAVDVLFEQALHLTRDKNMLTLQKELLKEKQRVDEIREKWQTRLLQGEKLSTLSSEIDISNYLKQIAKLMKTDQN